MKIVLNKNLYVNIGCGKSPTKGWLNFDNSLSIKLAKWPSISKMLYRLNLVDSYQYELIKFLQKENIIYADVRKKIPLGDGTVVALYSSHMLEHLDRKEAKFFLKEVLRVMAPSGVVRISIPDLNKLCINYLNDGDSDKFMESMFTCIDQPSSFIGRLKRLIIGNRHHLWMYDGRGLSKLFQEIGFIDVSVMEPGKTKIRDHGLLDLHEREIESVYVEAVKSNTN